jgi:Phospholipase_D-nuclease N-terminal
MTIEEALPFLIPIVVLQLVLIVIALRDLLRPDRRVVGDNKVVWGLVIVVFQFVGPLVYLVGGRKEE